MRFIALQNQKVHDVGTNTGGDTETPKKLVRETCTCRAARNLNTEFIAHLRLDS